MMRTTPELASLPPSFHATPTGGDKLFHYRHFPPLPFMQHSQAVLAKTNSAASPYRPWLTKNSIVCLLTFTPFYMPLGDLPA
ncbi:hypothetical protein AVEN_120036-1 [Araneus ventricosus]|uniref:Uncharacterized protein n=1 Tax=Araneus ventricosus TaxID=182803 RepID=A0A4Y2V5I7_ARAVE|nr:hypothetical protein AVEN_120036-1 [Araneus ventricosus]